MEELHGGQDQQTVLPGTILSLDTLQLKNDSRIMDKDIHLQNPPYHPLAMDIQKFHATRKNKRPPLTEGTGSHITTHQRALTVQHK